MRSQHVVLAGCLLYRRIRGMQLKHVVLTTHSTHMSYNVMSVVWLVMYPAYAYTTLDPLQSCCLLVTVQFSIGETMKDFGLTGTPCAGASVPSLAYNGIIPGPLVDRTQ